MAPYGLDGLEKEFLEGIPDEDIGMTKELFSAKTEIEGQDGGVVTSLLVAGIENGIFDCVVVAERKNGFRAVPLVTSKKSEIIQARGSKYLVVPMVSAVGSAVKNEKRKIGVVTLPCGAVGIRKIQSVLLRNVPVELTVIGLFCMENFFMID
jgi:coenzyme F420 hydrogenase subunit beta